MVSLTLSKKDVAGILRHVYLCLGKEVISYQDLVFFMAYDLMLYPPTTCEKVIASGKEGGHLSISPDKIVEFNIPSLDQVKGSAQASCLDIAKAFSDDSTLNKAVLLKKNRISSVSIDDKGVVATALGEQGQALKIKIDRGRKLLHQDHDEDVDQVNGKPRFLKYLIKIISLNMSDTKIQDMLNEINDQKDKWSFSFARIEAA